MRKSIMTKETELMGISKINDTLESIQNTCGIFVMTVQKLYIHYGLQEFLRTNETNLLCFSE